MDTEIIASRRAAVRSHLIVQAPTHGQLILVRPNRAERLLARLLSSVLDARLARGQAPEASRLLATRAAWLTTSKHRSELADSWRQVLDRARDAGAVLDARVPVARTALLEAAAQINALAEVLRSTIPVSARDVARVRSLLTDGAGPVYAGGDVRGLVAGLTDDLAHPHLAHPDT